MRVILLGIKLFIAVFLTALVFICHICSSSIVVITLDIYAKLSTQRLELPRAFLERLDECKQLVCTLIVLLVCIRCIHFASELLLPESH
uniref:Uncharacterized protein n=1 Tax=Globisporangium ultimum (strain ATCC 200006 / CBS 805.95 / DAOM BR144) TaxID=431595 RepID=K3WM95_GLOUD